MRVLRISRMRFVDPNRRVVTGLTCTFENIMENGANAPFSIIFQISCISKASKGVIMEKELKKAF